MNSRRAVLIIAIFFTIAAANVAQAGVYNGWPCSMDIVFDGYDCSVALSNFPVLVVLSTNIDGFAYDQFVSPTAGDLRFADSNDTDELSFEIEEWNTAGVSYVWVRVPLLSGPTDMIKAYWGNTSETNLPLHALDGSTWDSRYLAVWHLNQTNVADEIKDSTANGRHGGNGGVTNAPGMISLGQTGMGSVNLAFVRPLPHTVSAWVRVPPGTDANIMEWGWSSGWAQFHVSGALVYQDHNGMFPGGVSSPFAINDNTFYHVAMIRFAGTPGNSSLFINGRLVAGNSGFYASAINNGLKIMGSFTNGVCDEVRYTSGQRTTNWFWASYMSQGSNDSFLTYGAVDETPDVDINNADGASSVTYTSAVLNGVLVNVGDGGLSVDVLWGPTDGGTDLSAWLYTNSIGSMGAGGFTTEVFNLTADRSYFYRSYASSASETGWADSSSVFITGDLTMDSCDAYEESEYPGDITFHRPATCSNGDLLVTFSVGGTATEGSDYANVERWVVISNGLESQSIPILPFDDNVALESSENVDVTLNPGPYVIPGAGTVRAHIIDNDFLYMWPYTMEITFPGYARTSVLTGFPMLVVFSTNIAGFSYEHFQKPLPTDLRFIDTDNMMSLPYEIEHWNTNGTSYLWVRLPIMADTETAITATWGNKAMTDAPRYWTNFAVWSEDFGAVWHMHGSNNVYDSSPDRRHSVGDPGMNSVTGQIGFARDSGSMSVSVLGESDPFELTMSCWLKTTNNGGIIDVAAPGNVPNKHFTVENDKIAYTEYKTKETGWDLAYGDVVRDGLMHHVAAVKVSSAGNATLTFYKDGVKFIPSTNIEHVFGEVSMSVSTGGGLADEIRMSTTTRSTDWIWACWASQGGVPGFTVYGDIERFIWGGTTVIMK